MPIKTRRKNKKYRVCPKNIKKARKKLKSKKNVRINKPKKTNKSKKTKKQVKVAKKGCFRDKKHKNFYSLPDNVKRKRKEALLNEVESSFCDDDDESSFFDINDEADDQLIGTPKEVRKELDALALRMQKRPNNSDFDKIHYYIHKYLLGLVFKKFNFIKGYDENDMYQESLIALSRKAIPKFNPNKGMSFLNFAKMCINRHLITILHASRNRKKDIPMNTAVSIDHSPVEHDDGEMSPLSNVIADDNNKTLPYKKMVDKETFMHTFEAIQCKLSSFETVVLEEYLNEKSYREVAKGVTRRLSKRHNAKSIDNALLRIRKKAQEIVHSGRDLNF